MTSKYATLRELCPEEFGTLSDKEIDVRPLVRDMPMLVGRLVSRMKDMELSIRLLAEGMRDLAEIIVKEK